MYAAELHHRNRRRVSNHRSGATSRDLRSHIDTEIIEKSKGDEELHEAVKPERCIRAWWRSAPASARTSREAREQVRNFASAPSSSLRSKTGCAWARPARIRSPDWRKQGIYPGRTLPDHRRGYENRRPRESLIFGLHVHIGVEDREAAIHLMNAARYFVPHLLALSSNSPFWQGMDMGLKIVPLQSVR